MFKWIRGWNRWISGRIKYFETKRWMEERATCSAVKMAVTGAIKTHP